VRATALIRVEYVPDAAWPVEPASPADAEVLAGLLASAMPDAWTCEMVVESIEAGARGLLIRGGAAGSSLPLAAGAIFRLVGSDAEILQLAVAPDSRRRGLGRFLLRRVLSECARHGVQSVFLEVRAGNVAAREMYAREGFVETGVRARYYRNGEDARVLRLEQSFPLPSC
jgi:ribosomal-protein-alanine N-acetyltransferase